VANGEVITVSYGEDTLSIDCTDAEYYACTNVQAPDTRPGIEPTRTLTEAQLRAWLRTLGHKRARLPKSLDTPMHAGAGLPGRPGRMYEIRPLITGGYSVADVSIAEINQQASDRKLGTERRYSHAEVENAAGIAAEMAQSESFAGWIEERSDALNGWSGFVFLTIRVAPMVERIVGPDGWEDLHFYDMLPIVAEALFAYEGDYEDETALFDAINGPLVAEIARLRAELPQGRLDTRCHNCGAEPVEGACPVCGGQL